jgi:hypothetical protein
MSNVKSVSQRPYKKKSVIHVHFNTVKNVHSEKSTLRSLLFEAQEQFLKLGICISLGKLGRGKGY